MARFLNTWLLAAGAVAMVAIGAAVIVMAGMGDTDTDNPDSPGAAEASEQHVYLMNLGMG